MNEATWRQQRILDLLLRQGPHTKEGIIGKIDPESARSSLRSLVRNGKVCFSRTDATYRLKRGHLKEQS